jgi:hypothetical protein
MERRSFNIQQPTVRRNTTRQEKDMTNYTHSMIVDVANQCSNWWHIQTCVLYLVVIHDNQGKREQEEREQR